MEFVWFLISRFLCRVLYFRVRWLYSRFGEPIFRHWEGGGPGALLLLLTKIFRTRLIMPRPIKNEDSGLLS